MKKIISIIFVLLFLLSASITVSAQEDASIEIKAKSVILMDISTGKVLFKKNENEKLPPASVTKIMPILLVCEAIDRGDISMTSKVTVSPIAASKGGSQIWLKEGETMTVKEMLKATCVSSANDACTALGEFLAGSESAFVELMNKRAKELGMKNTHFENCTGLDDTATNHYTTAHDIALMSREVMKHDFITEFTTIWMDSLRDGKTELVNTNKLVRFYKGATGLKTGMTGKAGHCLSATSKRGDTHLVAVVLGSGSSADRFDTARNLLDWGFAHYVTLTPQIDKNLLTDVNVLFGTENTVKPISDNSKKILIEKSNQDKLKQDISLSLDVEAPVEKGQILGTVKISLGSEILETVNIISPKKIERLKFSTVLKRLLCSIA